MIIRMKAGLTGTRNGQDWPPPGGTIELDDAEAADLVAAGLAVTVEGAERADVVAAESAMVTPAKPRRSKGVPE